MAVQALCAEGRVAPVDRSVTNASSAAVDPVTVVGPTVTAALRFIEAEVRDLLAQSHVAVHPRASRGTCRRELV